jgi:glucan phosphoethanolaminetransferase (alkaline phosphatase superfamily)
MRTTIIPAQITTVEDKVAGNLSMAQILIMLIPVGLTAMIYILLAPSMKLVTYKLILIIAVTIICLILSIRIKDKIVAEWLSVLIKYTNRPRYYLFNKNNLTGRTIDLPIIPKERHLSKTKAIKNIEVRHDEINLSDQIKLDDLVNSGKVALHYRFESDNS